MYAKQPECDEIRVFSVQEDGLRRKKLRIVRWNKGPANVLEYRSQCYKEQDGIWFNMGLASIGEKEFAVLMANKEEIEKLLSVKYS